MSKLGDRFRKRLRAARLARGWTVAKAAEKAGVAAVTWYAWEYGRREPNFAHIERAAKALRVGVRKLLF